MTAERTKNPPRMPPTIPPIAPEERDEPEFTGAAVCVDVEGPPELLNEAMDVGKNVDAIAVEEELAVVDDWDVIVKEVTATVVGMMTGDTTDVIVGPAWVVVIVTGEMLVTGPCVVVVTGTCVLVWGIAGRLRNAGVQKNPPRFQKSLTSARADDVNACASVRLG